MSRRQSVAFCLLDVGFLSDPKFRRLARRLPDPDDFNSAIGAYFVALAASRRNGDPKIDAKAETDSSHVDALIEVGLLEEDGFPQKAWNSWDAMGPQRAAGLARSEKAARNEAGRFTSESSGLESAGSAGSAGPAFPSPPLLSTPVRTEEGAVGEKQPDTWELYCGLTGTSRPSPNVVQWLTKLEDRYGAGPMVDAMTAEWGDGQERRTFLSRVEHRLEKAAREVEVASQHDTRTRRIQEQMQTRRLKWFRNTGKWEAEWGPRPAESVA